MATSNRRAAQQSQVQSNTSQEDDEVEAAEFEPVLVYRSASDHKLAATADERDALLKDGWFATVPEALDALKAAKK